MNPSIVGMMYKPMTAKVGKDDVFFITDLTLEPTKIHLAGGQLGELLVLEHLRELAMEKQKHMSI